MADEKQLVDALRRGDREAFDAVYDRYRPRVFAFLGRLCGDRALAEDLLQETFVRLARRSRDLAPETHLRPWLFTVARNLYVDHRRWALLDFDRLRNLALWPSRAQHSLATPFDLANATQAERRIEAALLGLPTKYREAVLLIAVEGLTPTEAAGVLGTTPEALRQRLSRGRALLRDRLEKA